MVHDIIQRARAEPNLNSMYRSSMDLNALIQIMFQDRHFINGKRYHYHYIVLTGQLAKKQAANKLEKFIAEQLQEKVKSMIIDSQIQGNLKANYCL